MLNSEHVWENETHKILCDFEIKMDPPLVARRVELVLINQKKACHLVDFAITGEWKWKNAKKRLKLLGVW